MREIQMRKLQMRKFYTPHTEKDKSRKENRIHINTGPRKETCIYTQTEGFEPSHRLLDDRISSAARYDHFDTSAQRNLLYFNSF